MQTLDTFTAANQRLPAAGKEFTGPFNLITRDMSGSTVKLVYSDDDGQNWFDAKEEEVLIEVVNKSTIREYRNRTDWRWALVCTTYGGSPFRAGLIRAVRGG
jgi:hypothetical protein